MVLPIKINFRYESHPCITCTPVNESTLGCQVFHRRRNGVTEVTCTHSAYNARCCFSIPCWSHSGFLGVIFFTQGFKAVRVLRWVSIAIYPKGDIISFASQLYCVSFMHTLHKISKYKFSCKNIVFINKSYYMYVYTNGICHCKLKYY